MGMAASQGRLLFMTARLSNNEFEQQSVAYSKQRLAETSQLANDKYLEALNATSYQILVGYNGTDANFENVTYSQLTGPNNVAVGKQYIVQDRDGKILVTQAIADAFEKANGDYNKFLKKFDLTQSDIDVNNKTVSLQMIHNAWDKYLTSVGQGINAAPTNVGNDIEGTPPGDSRHILGFGFTIAEEYDPDEGTKKTGILTGYPVYKTAHARGKENTEYAGMEFDVVNQEGGTSYINAYPVYITQNSSGQYIAVYRDAKNEQHVLEGYEVDVDPNNPYKITSYTDAEGNTTELGEGENIYVHPYLSADSSMTVFQPSLFASTTGTVKLDENFAVDQTQTETPIPYEGTTAAQRALYDYAVAITEAFYNKGTDHSGLKNDKSLITYYQNIYNVMLTKGYTTYEQMRTNNYISSTSDDEKKAYSDDEWLVRQLKNGKLNISYFSAVERNFVSTSLDDDESITEKEDKSKMAIAEQVYNSTMDRIEREDKYFDMQLNKLEAEHSALQTEYESVAKVIQKNVEKSFNTFNA
jgi:hypothetical protein